MKITEALANDLTAIVEGESWSDPDLKNVLADVSFIEAISLTAASPNNIASIVYHLNFYNDILFDRLNGRLTTVNSANGFDMPPLKNEEEWQALKALNMSSAKKLTEFIKTLPDEFLFVKLPGQNNTPYQDIHGVAEHAAYHLGQIVILKKLLRSGK